MTGTIRKTRATATNFPVSERLTVRANATVRSSIGGLRRPAIAEAGIIGDGGEGGVDRQELLADTLDQGADIGAIAVRAFAGDEILAAQRIVDLAVAEVAARGGQQFDHAIFAEGQLDRTALPGGGVACR